MRADELTAEALLSIDEERAVVRFAGQRAIILDAVALGILRQLLIEAVGERGARSLLTRLGFAHGWRMADALSHELHFDSPRDFRLAGARIHELQGIVRTERTGMGPLSDAGATLHGSYEAEQHLMHLGRADEPVCWTLCGFASGYLSRVEGTTLYVLEDACIGRGDPCCTIRAKTRAQWGEERTADLAFFDEQTLETSIEPVLREIRRAERKLRARRREVALSGADEDVPAGFIVRSAAMRAVLEQVRRVAPVDTTVLVTGETGTGKERIARLLHTLSARTSGPFLAINCGAVPDDLLDAELFGHVRGAFTGAQTDRVGLFEAANGGTLMLDEIGDVSPAMQVKLLRVLQEREVRRLGETAPRPIDVRIVAATHRDLAAEVSAGRFREDLYYRLRVIELGVPPLRARRDDVLPLARWFLSRHARAMKRSVPSLSPRAADQLARYGWPGNVRELDHAMERAVALAAEERIELFDLPEEVRAAEPAGALRSLRDVERAHILATLEACGGNQRRAAEALGIGTATLYRKLKEYGARAK